MIRRPPRSTQGVSSAASDVYKRQEPHCNVHDQLVDGSRARKYPQFDFYTAQMQALILMLHMKTHRLPTGHYGSLADLRGDFAFGGFMTLNGHRLSTANAEKFRHEILSNAISCYLCGYSARAMQRHQFHNVRDYYRMLKGIGEMAISFSATWLIERAWGCLLYTSPSPRDRTRSRMPSSA